MNSKMFTHPEWQQDGFTVSTDPVRLDVSAIHRFLLSSLSLLYICMY